MTQLISEKRRNSSLAKKTSFIGSQSPEKKFNNLVWNTLSVVPAKITNSGDFTRTFLEFQNKRINLSDVFKY